MKTIRSLTDGFIGILKVHSHNESNPSSTPAPMRNLPTGNVHENHSLRLLTVMSDCEFSLRQRDIVMTVYRLWGQHCADKLVSYFIKANENRKEVILSMQG